ncbi:MAG: autotransporter-associated beta strand repeat-containing protein [Verrucomicrobia bacterium]|nr:autotransporter-associated beta strand repeat-containing protein [Verrucomicrobiota bacterium]
MKLNRISLYLPLVLSALASANAATLTRSTTTDNLNVTTAWTGGVVPTVADVATWDAASTLTNTMGANLTWGGLDVSAAAGAVTISGTNTLACGALNLGANSLAITSSTANSSQSFSSLTGTGTLTISNGTANLGMTPFNTANALNFNGTLRLRGGNATTAPNAMAGSFFYLGRTGVSQAAGTAFALDTGAATNDAKDVVLDGDAWNNKTITLSSLTGYGTIRCDSGAVNPSTRFVVVDQAVDTTFNGLMLSHASSAATNVVRKLSFEKKGAGTLTLAGIVGKQTQSAGAAAANIDLTVTAGKLVLTAANTRTGATTVASGATLQAGDGGTGGLIGGSAVTNDGSIVLNYGTGASVTLANTFSGAGTITKTGDGGAILTGNSSSFAGNITLNAGSLRLGPNLGAGTLAVKDGGFISAGLPAANGTSVVGGLTLENNTESDFRLGASTDKIQVTNTDGLTVPGTGETHTINLVNQPSGGGTLTLIDYSGTALTTEQFGRFVLGDLPFGAATYQLVNNTANTSIDVLVTLEDQVWKGTTDGNWDTATTNWALASTPATPAAFNVDHPVLFDDSAALFAVTVDAAGMPPLSTTFDNTLNAYTLTGGEIYGSTSLLKKGTNTVTLSQSNSYTGGTTVNAGTLVFDGLANTSSGGTTVNGGMLRIGSGGTTGDIGSGAVSVAAGATLEFNRSNAVAGTADLDYKTNAKMRTVSGGGDIVLTGGAILFNYTSSNAVGGGVSFDDPNAWTNFSGNLIVKGGSEFRTIRNGATAMGTGDIILGDATTSGVLAQIEGNWTWTNDIVLNGADNKIINRSVTPGPRRMKLQGAISGAGGLTLQDATGALTDPNTGIILTGLNTLTGTLTIDTGVPVRVGGVPGNTDVNQAGADNAGSLGAAAIVNNGTLTFSRKDAHTVANAISGTGALRVGIPAAANLGDTSTQTVTLTGAGTYAGATTVNNGKLVVASGASIAGSGVSVTAGATLSGSGAVGAPVTAAGTIAPGDTIGALPVTGNTVLTGSLAIEVDGTAADKLAVTGDLDLTGSTLVVQPSGAGFTQASYVIAECTGVLTGLPAAPSGYTVAANGSQVILSAAAGYDAWKAANAGGQGPELDFDGDGVPNGVEYFMGETGSTFTSNPVPVNGKVTWPRDTANAITSFKVQISETLAPGDWTDITPPHASIDESVAGEVSFTLPTGAVRKFCRLVVVP